MENSGIKYSFEDLKETFDSYALTVSRNNTLTATDRSTGNVHWAKELLDMVMFSYSWMCATILTNEGELPHYKEPITEKDYFNAFSSKGRDVYEYIMGEACRQVREKGNIDPYEISAKALSENKPYISEFTKHLFSRKRWADSTLEWAKNKSLSDIAENEINDIIDMPIDEDDDIKIM